MLFKKLHSIKRFLINTLASPAVINFLRTFNRKRKRKVAARFDILAKLIVNKRTVGKRKENAILIFPCKGNNIFFANKRFTARKHIKMSAERLAFAYNSAHFVKSEV